MKHVSVFVVSLALLGVAPPAVRAELASLVADLEVDTGPNQSSYPHFFERVGSRVVFFVPSPGTNGLPWTTDGTAAGTARLPGDPLVGSVGTVAGEYLWFGEVRRDPQRVYSLWHSNGRAGGTARLVGTVYSPPVGAPSIPWTREGDRIYFFRKGGELELWESDGTAAGTRRTLSLPRVRDDVFQVVVHRGGFYFLTAVLDWTTGMSDPGFVDWKLWQADPATGSTRVLHRWRYGGGDLLPAKERLLFFPGDDAGLWTTDGTVRGTAPVPGPPGRRGFPWTWIKPVDGKVYVGTGAGRYAELWVCDGSAAGTRLLARVGLAAEYDVHAGVSLGNQYFFVAYDEEHGSELWRTRGTADTTALVADICPGRCSAFAEGPHHLAVAAGRIFLFADDGRGAADLWVSDGTRQGTHKVLASDLGGGWPMRADGQDVFFYHGDASGRGLWASDGSAAGTRRLLDFTGADPADPNPVNYSEQPVPMATLGSRIVTLGYDPRGGFEPWVVARDGRGGHPLGDLATGGQSTGSEPIGAVALGERLLFTARRGGSSTTVCSTEGSPETTQELGVVPGWPNVNPPRIAVVAGVAYLNLEDLWTSDGSAAGMVRLTDLAALAPGTHVSSEIVDLDGRAVFAVSEGGWGATAFWSSDGTSGGTGPAGSPSALPSFPRPIYDLTASGQDLFFWADDGVNDWELWTAADGLREVRRLSDFKERFSGGHLSGLTRIGADVYLFLELSTGWQIWRTDGTLEGTRRVDPPAIGGTGQWPQAIAGVEGSLLLLTSSGPDGSRLRLWVGDGSVWAAVHDFGVESHLQEVVSSDGGLLLLVKEGRARRLYRSDGTTAGTQAVLDLTGLGRVESVTPVGGRYFFAAGAKMGFTEPWISDGTPGGTRRLQEIAPGPAGSQPSGFLRAGSRLYFSADDGLHGRELWSLPLDGLDAPCRPSPTALCLGGGRFRAELFRHDGRGERGDGRALPWSSATGAFWFYRYDLPEAVVKVDETYRLFFGPLSDAHLALTVTDLKSGESRRYPAVPGPLPAFVDLLARPAGAAESSPPQAFGERRSAGPPPAGNTAGGPCVPDSGRLCLHGGRFAAELVWRDGSGRERSAQGLAHSGEAGYFVFHGTRYVEAALKILDHRAVNGRFWLYWTALTRRPCTLTLTDTMTGAVYRYPKPAGEVVAFVDRTSIGS